MEKDEMEKDAATLKLPMAIYLESFAEAFDSNLDDADELALIFNKIVADKNTIDLLYGKVNEQLNLVRNSNAKRTEVRNLLAQAIRERKEQ